MGARKKPPADAAPEKVFNAGIVREDEKYLYFIEKNGDVVRMVRGVPRAPTEVLVKTGIRRERGWMYYVDEQGDVAREPDSD